jgi:hypothetical protein
VIAGNVVLLGVGGGVTAFDPVTGIERWHTDWACGPGADIATARQAFYVSGFDICKVNLRPTAHRSFTATRSAGTTGGMRR